MPVKLYQPTALLSAKVNMALQEVDQLKAILGTEPAKRAFGKSGLRGKAERLEDTLVEITELPAFLECVKPLRLADALKFEIGEWRYAKNYLSAEGIKTKGGDLLKLAEKLERTLEEIKEHSVKRSSFGSPLRVVLGELHSATGRIDAKKVAEFLGVKLPKFCRGLGLKYDAVHKNPDSESIQPALKPLKRSLEILHDVFGNGDTIRAWLNTLHPDLGMTPMDAILSKRAEALHGMLESALEGIAS